MKYIGGYSILDLNDTTNVSKQANACYNQDKPVLVYGANGERYFADTITKSGTNIVITKGGKTITIANDNTITSVGDIQPKYLHLYNVSIQGKFGDDDINFIMNIYSNKELKTGEVLLTDLELIDELNNYEDTFIYDNNNIVKTIAVYENLFIEDNKLEFNFCDDEGESSLATGTTAVYITKVF